MGGVFCAGMAVVLIAGCSIGCVTTDFEKTVTVRKDASGQTVETVVMERALQRRSVGRPIIFRYMKGVDASESAFESRKLQAEP